MRTHTLSIALLIAACIVASGFFSCKSDEAPDTQKPTITIDEPAANDTLTTVSDVHIEVTATDNEKLQRMSVNVTNPSNISLFSANPAVSGLQTYAFHEHFTPTAGVLVQLTLTVTAVDEAGNTETQTRIFFLRP